MNEKLLWILGPALFSIIGMVAGYLSQTSSPAIGALAGAGVGFLLTIFALAGERSGK